MDGVQDLNGSGGKEDEKAVILSAFDWWDVTIFCPECTPLDFVVVVVDFASAAPDPTETDVEAICRISNFSEAPCDNEWCPDGVRLVEIRKNGVAWFVDATPESDGEFEANAWDPYTLSAPAGSAAAGRYDLLSCMLHEIGHAVGFSSAAPAGTPRNQCGLYQEYCTQLHFHQATNVAYVASWQQRCENAELLECNADADCPSGACIFPHTSSETTNTFVLESQTNPHLSEAWHPSDLMSPRVAAGDRHLPSEIDAEILEAAWFEHYDVVLQQRPSPADEGVPTLSEWGLIVLGLLLAGGLVVVWSRQPVVATAGGACGAPLPPLFVARVFWPTLAVAALAGCVGLAIAFALQGEVAAVDVGGTLLCTPLVAYLAHYWIAMRGS
jgi:hypothetical protein